MIIVGHYRCSAAVVENICYNIVGNTPAHIVVYKTVDLVELIDNIRYCLGRMDNFPNVVGDYFHVVNICREVSNIAVVSVVVPCKQIVVEK